MSIRRDSLFPPGSLGRHSPVPRVPSHESISTHPLLSPPPPASPTTAASPDNGAPANPRYVPYTPRQRVAPTSATTGTTMHPSMSASQQQNPFQGDATSKLQMMNLKAAAQRIGLDAASTGWAILERLSTEADHGPEWNEIWNALSVSKATLLLPLNPHRASEPITPEFIKDHIALCDGASRNNAPIVTLSGLRGTLTDVTLTMRSAIPTSSPRFQALLTPCKRASALTALPPLPSALLAPPPVPPSPSSSVSSITSALPQYPTFTAPTYTSSLPLPPRPATSKPPLPPRPGARVPPAPSNPTSRLSNPFASLFGRNTPTASPSPSISPLHPEPAHTPSSTSTISTTTSLSAVSSGSDSAGAQEHALEIPVYTIATHIDRAALGHALWDAVTGEMRAALWDAGVPPWVVERAERFAQPLFPLVPTSTGDAGKDTVRKAGTEARGVGRVVSASVRGRGKGEAEWVAGGAQDETRAEELSERFQAFYVELEDAVWARWEEDVKKGRGRRKGLLSAGARVESEMESAVPNVAESESDTEHGSEEKTADENEEDKEGNREAWVCNVMDAVERVVCSLFYDRLFLPADTDDASHDEALASRIAAVNLLDLGLAHLGVDVGNAGEHVEAVVNQCGQTLAQLDVSRRAPMDKAAVLVSVHKIIVDGLSKLPPIGLKSEEELLDEKTPRAASFVKSNSAPEDDEDDEHVNNFSLKHEPKLQVDTLAATTEAPLASPTIVVSPIEASEDDKDLLNSAQDTAVSPSAESKHLSPSGPARNGSPGPSVASRSSSPTPVSGDVILPLMIFAVVKANPPRLVSNLLYTQRFRRESASGGEEGYCLINLMAVAEFLENVDLAALGLSESEKTVLSTAELSPIPLARSVRVTGADPASPQVTHPSFRGRVEQQVDAIAGSANKVITGVVDSSFGVLRSLLPGQAQSQPNANAENADESGARPGFGILRRDTGFSIASLAASLPGSRARVSGPTEESGQQMVEVPSRPGSSRSVRGADDAVPASDEESGEEGEEDEEYDEDEYGHDTRSIRSFESMMSGRSGRSKKRRRQLTGGRMSLTDRLASMPGLSRLSQNQSHDAASKNSPPGSRRSSLLLPNATTQTKFDSPVSSRVASPIAIRISPPNPRFLNCTEDEIRVSEVAELLREYKRLAEAIRAMGGFHEN
ncbi:hypothetical protein WOLCODRAFT_105227 [Wolfiporia cocos MD-104 SS10]|uniref:VPS9 domain-containing protein n=1 Tax=Wolfiporia cocos (strain MD-104) TaxID=742152 RepID=A0A2H3K2Y9_WOLCO|nr:hypothetical protein WOLCODRAFT_105227 [Wolfiporia cocos MD-104 SS10]